MSSPISFLAARALFMVQSWRLCEIVLMRHLTCLALLVAMAVPSLAAAQTTQDGRLIVTVLDSSGAVVPGASVTISALDDGARAATFAPVTTSDKGIATV